MAAISPTAEVCNFANGRRFRQQPTFSSWLQLHGSSQQLEQWIDGLHNNIHKKQVQAKVESIEVD